MPEFCRSSGIIAAYWRHVRFLGVFFVMGEFTWMEGMDGMLVLLVGRRVV